jgi:hypothetical protein
VKKLLTYTLAALMAACAGSKQEDSAVAIQVPTANPDPSTASPAPDGTRPTGLARSASLTTKESRAVARTMARVIELRGLRSTGPVPGVALDRVDLVARIKEKALREYPADALRREGQLLQLFGFAPPSFDYLAEMMKLLEAQLEGFYEPNDGTMYIAADLRGKEADATLAHELVHALQDQNWDLKARSTYRAGKGDETLALACLAEGDATSLMMDYMLSREGKTALDLPETALRQLMAGGMNTPELQSIPHILRSTLVAPYIDGLAYVHALRRKGGFPLVDQAWRKPPTTTEQVLHVEKWERAEAPIAVAVPPAHALGSGFRLVDDDSFGEVGFALAFEEWIGAREARAIASGWGGDRAAVYAKGDEIAFAVHLRYDDATAATPAALHPDAFAERAATKLMPALKKKLPSLVIDTPDTVCFERKDLGPLVLSRRTRSLVIAIGPARQASGTWSSSATCAQAKQWAAEVLASP